DKLSVSIDSPLARCIYIFNRAKTMTALFCIPVDWPHQWPNDPSHHDSDHNGARAQPSGTQPPIAFSPNVISNVGQHPSHAQVPIIA
ncbi:MAG: hypothetical protein AAFV46_01935, partial [Cyanobacteria bacterium J06635_11]